MPMKREVKRAGPVRGELRLEFLHALDKQLERIERAVARANSEQVATYAKSLETAGVKLGVPELIGPSKQLVDEVAAGETESAMAILGELTQLSRELRESIDRPQRAASASTPTRDAPLTSEDCPAPLRSSLPVEDSEIRSIVVGWVERLASQMVEMHQAAKSEDYQELASLAHWLKGSAGTVGFGDFTAPSKALQQAAQNGNAEEIRRLIGELEALSARIERPVKECGTP